MQAILHRSSRRPDRAGRALLPGRRIGTGVLAAVGLLGCHADPVERAPEFSGSPGGGFNGALISSGSGGTGGDTSQPIGPGGSSAATGLVRGQVLEFLSDDFLATDVHLGSVEVWGETGRADAWVHAAAEDGEFELDGVQLAPGTFLGVRPTVDSASEFLRTLSNEDTQTNAANVALVARATVDSIYETLVVPSNQNLTAAQVVVRIKDTLGRNLAGVSVAVAGSEFTTYASLGSWTEYADSTTTEGMAFVGNVPAGAFPGQRTTIRLTGGLLAAVRAPVAAGTVTVVNVVAGELSSSP